MSAGSPDATVLTDGALDRLAAELCQRAERGAAQRVIVGIAGVPGSGKSTLAGRLHEAVRETERAAAVLIPMDGFHLSNERLAALDLSGRKGAPETFDASGYIATLRRFRNAADTGRFPVYDRMCHEPVWPGDDASRVTADTRLILTEGNYLLLDESPWRELADVLDETWWLDTPMETARQWITKRHRAVGRTQTDAERRWHNDRQNAQRVLQAMRAPDRVLRWPNG